MRLKFTFLLTLSGILSATNVFGQDTLKTMRFDMEDCIPLYLDEQTPVITSKESLNQLIRKDGSNERCVELLKGFDFENYSLLGINLNSGSCRVPLGLNFFTVKNVSEKKYILEIGYDEPVEPCRAMSSYDLWVKVPALPEGYTVQFVINPRRDRDL